MKFWGAIAILVLILAACNKGDTPIQHYALTPYHIEIPKGFPSMHLSAENPITVEGVALGRKLYYDPIIDGIGSRSCGGCHLQAQGFSSAGEVLPHVNLGFYSSWLWNGKVQGTMEDIMRFEVEDFFFTDMQRIYDDPTYDRDFRRVFGKEDYGTEEVSYALAQFIRTMISSNSPYDKRLRGEANLTEEQWRGYEIFFSERGDCFHCHGTVLLTDNIFHNNGLDANPDSGRSMVTGSSSDLGKFKTPTLRNLAFTAPYMHDGRYNTLEEVVDFYSEGLQYSATIDPLMKNVHNGGIHLTPAEKSDLIAFLFALTDSSYIVDARFSKP
jgi:cytochrome c peroxidase